MKKFLNIQESADYLGINRSTFRRWEDIGIIPNGIPVSKTGQRRIWTTALLDQAKKKVDSGIYA
jgi:predicted site-specific integrase-resolvase|tara:strand:+ start:386 stop:577 length:192 start_codon:yes stop_codon:yes gene_type:complete